MDGKLYRVAGGTNAIPRRPAQTAHYDRAFLDLCQFPRRARRKAFRYWAGHEARREFRAHPSSLDEECGARKTIPYQICWLFR